MSRFADLRAFLAARDDADSAVAPGMRSILLEGSTELSVILLHGLTASPPAWSSIAADLNARGATVAVVRLPLHGHADRLSTALAGLTTNALTDDLCAVVKAVTRLGGRIVVAGHSLGGTLALYAASFAEVERVVAIAPFLGIAAWPRELEAALVAFINKLPTIFLWWDPVERERQMPAHGYPRYPLHALGVGLRLAAAVYATALRRPSARAVDLVINVQESSVNNRSVDRLARRWRAAGTPVVVHRLAGLPPSHDIIEPARSSSARVRETLVSLLLAEASHADDVVHLI